MRPQKKFNFFKIVCLLYKLNNMVRVFRTSLVILVHILVNFSVKSQDYYYNQNTENYYNYPTIPTITEYQGGTIVDYVYTFTKSKSPYIVRNDIIIEENAEVRIEPGVDIQFEPQIGITVRGVLTILVSNLIFKNFKSAF